MAAKWRTVDAPYQRPGPGPAVSRYGRSPNTAHHLTVFKPPVISCQDLRRSASLAGT